MESSVAEKKSASKKSEKPARKLRKPVESVREQAAKQEESTAKPRRLHQTRRSFSAPFRLLGKVFKRLNRIKPFRILGFILVPPYFRNSWKELRQVTWPSFKTSRQLTLAVIIFATIFGLFVALLDVGLSKLFKQVLLK